MSLPGSVLAEHLERSKLWVKSLLLLHRPPPHHHHMLHQLWVEGHAAELTAYVKI